jgi:hypothetical protein
MKIHQYARKLRKQLAERLRSLRHTLSGVDNLTLVLTVPFAGTAAKLLSTKIGSFGRTAQPRSIGNLIYGEDVISDLDFMSTLSTECWVNRGISIGPIKRCCSWQRSAVGR